MSIKKKHIITIILVIAVIISGIFAYRNKTTQGKIVYKDYLDKTVAKVGNKELSFRDAAFYVAYEEKTVQEQAIVYNPEKTSQYWNLHVDGEFVRVAASKSAISMLVHDEIFYQMAQKEGVTLNQDEQTAYGNSERDFWTDLTDIDGQTALGISEDDIKQSMEKAAIAQKYQQIYAQINKVKFEDYNISGDAYQELLEKSDYEIDEELWKRIDMGNITLDH